MTSVLVRRLEFCDFKSYAGRVVVGPFNNFTCIVGPNGAGKSNIMDGLSFVLAGSVSRTGDVRDLINKSARNSNKAKADASVTMVLIVGGTKEVSFTRSIKGTGAIETRIDGHVVSEKEFGLGLRKYRIGVRVSNFLVFQHEVEAVAHKKARELTELLEQVSGSGELKTEYNAKKRALDAITEDLKTASMEKRGAHIEMQQLKLHKREADRYEQLQRSLSEERRDLALAELFHIEAQLSLKKRQLDEQQTKVAQMQGSVATEDDLRRGKKDFADQHKRYLEEVKRNREKTLDLREKRATLDRIKAAVDHHQRKVARLVEELKASTTNDNIRSKEAKRLEDQLAQQQALLEQAEAQWKKDDAEQSRKSSLSADQLKEYKTLKAEVDIQTVTLRQQLDTLRRNRDALNVALRQVQIAVDSTEASLRDTNSAIERSDAGARSLHAKGDELRAQEKALVASIETSKIRLHQMHSRAAERESELANLDAQLTELKFVKDDNKQNSRANETMSALTSMFPGRVHGRVVDLCTIPVQRYRNAVTAAFGKFLDAVVVDTTETAMACVRYLKEQRVASMSFIPLNNAQGSHVTDTLRALGGSCKPVIDLLQYEPILEPAVRFAVGDTLVCDGMQEARRIAFGSNDGGGERRKVVTLDGTVLLKSGAVQGGLASTQSRARKWDEKLYEQLKSAREQLLRGAGETTEADLARAQFEAKDLQSNLDFTRNRIKTAENEQKMMDKKSADLHKSVKSHIEQLEKLKQRQAEHAKDVAKLEGQMHQLQKQISDLENNAFGDLQRRTGIANLAEWEQREANQMRQRAEKRQSFELTINRLKQTIEMEEKRHQARGVKDLQVSLEKTQKELKTAQSDLEKYSAVVDRLAKEQDDVQSKVNAAKEKLDEIEGQNRKQSKTTDAEVRELANARKLVTMVQSLCDALRQQRLSLFQRCRVEQIDLPTTTTTTDDEQSQGSGEQQQQQQQQGTGAGKNRRRQRDTNELPDDVPVHQLRSSEAFSSYSESGTTTTSSTGKSGSGKQQQQQKEVTIVIDFSSLSPEVKRELVKKETFAGFKKKAESTIDALVRDVESIALPNLKATAQLIKTEAKLGTSAAQVEEMAAKQKKAQDEFNQVQQLRTQRFMNTFHKLEQQVDGVYRQLTLGTRAADVHGSAYLTLEEPSEPYNGGTQYHATPPMKRFMTMDALSGGERTMAALALLFSIHLSTPTPFFVLDEVDAALDIGNVANLAQYMKQRCDSCQFLVVSLKEQLYHHADSLIGVYKDVERETSAILTLDVSKIQQQN